MSLSEEQRSKYITDGGVTCPYCGSHEITSTEPMQGDGGIAWQDITCPDCEENWTDQYKLINVN